MSALTFKFSIYYYMNIFPFFMWFFFVCFAILSGLPCFPGWSQSSKLKWSSCFILSSSWDANVHQHIWVVFFFFFLSVLIWDIILCSIGWLQTCSVAKNDPELLIFLPLLLQSLSTCVPTCQVFFNSLQENKRLDK